MAAHLLPSRARLLALILAAVMLAAAAMAVVAARSTSSATQAATAGVVRMEMKVTGHNSGVFPGDSPVKNHQDQILVSNFSFEVSSPRDPASGQASGKRQYKPITITKELNSSSPLFMHAAASNELLTSVVINFFKTDRTGKESNYYRVTLTNASISQVKQYSSGSTVDEDVSFTFQKVKEEDLIGKITFQDDWQAVS